MAVPRKTLGILTFHKCINYGSYWQARCELLDHGCEWVRRAEVRCALPRTARQVARRSDGRARAIDGIKAASDKVAD